MGRMEDTLRAHPRQSRIDAALVASFIRELTECSACATICADACLSEPDVMELARCVELDVDCADACDATLRCLARIGNQHALMLASQVSACQYACRLCAEECERHADHHEHCRVCAQACRSCEKACDPILQALRHPAGTGY